jgi:PAS domain S-box-containing protein
MSEGRARGPRITRRTRDAEERLQLFVDNVKDYAIFMTDPAGTIVSWNEGVARLLGHTEEEFLGRPFSIIFPPEDVERSAHQAELSAAAATGRAEDERWHVRRDGTRFWAMGVVTVLRDDQGRLRGFAKIMRDITERKLADEERAQLLVREQRSAREAEIASRARDQFLATLSHELRTPLNAIVGWTKLLQSRPRDADLIDRGLATIARNARIQTALIDDLLELRRTLAGDMTLSLRPVDVRRVVEAVVDSMSPEASAQSLTVETRWEAQAISVAGDPDRLEQIVSNLLSNAIKFTPPGGSVVVTLTHDDGFAILTVSDTGVGIDREFLPHVFEPFRQADSTTRRLHGGLGLGLAITQALVERHGGTLAADSEGRDCGTVFTVRLPLADPRMPEATLAMEDVPSVSLSGLRVLVIDDDAGTRDVVVTALELAGATVQIVSAAVLGLIAVSEARPDVIVCDVGLPQEDGFDFITKVRALTDERGGQTPAIALMANSQAEDRLRTLTSGFQLHLAKPVDLTGLVSAVASLCGRTRK